MKPETREFVEKNQKFLQLIEIEKERTIADIGKIMEVSAPTVYSILQEGRKKGVIKKEKGRTFVPCFGNFAGIYVKDNSIKIGIFDQRFNEIRFEEKHINGDFKRTKLKEIIQYTKNKYSFTYAALVIDGPVENGNVIVIGDDEININGSPDFFGNEYLICVNSTILNAIYIRQWITNENNFMYYSIKNRQFAVVENGKLKERMNDRYYGILPHFKDNNEIMKKLSKFEGDRYDNYYQEIKEKLFHYISRDIYSMVCMLRPEIVYLDSQIIKPKFIKKNFYIDIDEFCFNEIYGKYNMYIKPVTCVDINDRELLKAAAKYAEYKFFNWNLIW